MANRFLKELLAMPNNGLKPHHLGGYLTRRGPDGRIRFTYVIGNPPVERQKEYGEYSREKGRRLNVHPHHFSSWWSRRKRLKQYGGAIRTEDGGSLSFSGTNEMAEEALALLIADARGHITHENMLRVIKKSRNHLFIRFCAYYHLCGI
ncbi:hypothetical protein EPO05_04980 [Patescibacteria group bacterium]|nr:MAG: hypothetical protein EPO05_04980 [Patescibacteria group bacterium]